MGSASPYLLNRDPKEAHRLTVQHAFWVRNFDHHIHPKILSELPRRDAQIADVATGTGIWLVDLASNTSPLPQPSKDAQDLTSYDFSSFSYHGFDISPDQLPPLDAIPSNVHFHTHDIKKPFPEEYHGKFDLVHVRLLVLAMIDSDDWSNTIANLTTLLKPGTGWLQWEDINNLPMESILSSSHKSTTAFLEQGVQHLSHMAGDRFMSAPQWLRQGFEREESGLEAKTLNRYVVCSDRLHDDEGRRFATWSETMVVEGVGKQQLLDGVKGAWSDEKLKSVIEGMERDIESGGYVNFYMICMIGRRKAQ